MKVLITGSTGLIGSALGEFLSTNGHEVRGLLRNNFAEDDPHWNPEEGVIDLGNFTQIDAVIHLAGDNISEGRWNDAKKARILNSRVIGTKLIANFLAKLEHKPNVFISGSAIGFYGSRGEDVVDENSKPGKGFLSDVCKQWEEATTPAFNAGIRVVNIRTGMVLSLSGGALKKMLFPFKMGLGGIIGNGKQFMSWVSINDLVEMIQYAMTNDSLNGPLNLVSPNPVSNYQFTKTLGHTLRRPTMFPMPAFMARLLFGEMANDLLLASTKVIPQKLINAGYKFQHSELEKALQFLLR